MRAQGHMPGDVRIWPYLKFRHCPILKPPCVWRLILVWHERSESRRPSLKERSNPTLHFSSFRPNPGKLFFHLLKLLFYILRSQKPIAATQRLGVWSFHCFEAYRLQALQQGIAQ